MAKEKSMVKDLTEGSIPRLLMGFAAPLFVSNALQAVYNIVDMVVVGRVLGKTGMSAVTTGGNILHILTFLAMGFSGAGQVIIARSVGQQRMDDVKKIIGSLFTMLFTIAIAISAVCFVIRDQLLNWINTPTEAYEYTMDYTVICIFGLIFIYGYNCVSAIMRGMGDSKRPFMFVTIAAILNIILDILFVAGMGMEVMGAALATVIGQACSFIFAIVYLYKHKEGFYFDFKPKSFLPNSMAVGKIISLGIPMALQSAAVTISQTIVAAWVNSFGVTASAIAGILGKLNMMMGIMSNAVTTAGASMVGQNLGAKKYKRVPKILGWAFSISCLMAAGASVVIVRFHEQVFSMFTSDMDVVLGAVVIIGPAILNFFGAASRTFGFSIINGSGNSKLNLAVALLDGIVARIGMAWLLGIYLAMGPVGFWYGDAFAGFMPLVIGGLFYLSGAWKKEKVQPAR